LPFTLPETEPGYYFWKDRATRRADPADPSGSSPKTPEVRLGPNPHQVPDLVRLAAVLRAVARAIVEGRALRAALKALPWVAKLDTIITSYYHIDPAAAGCASSRTPTATRNTRTTRRSSRETSRR